MSLQDRLKIARKARDRTQQDVALGSGIGQSTYSDLENTAGAGSTFLIEIADYLKVNPIWLKTGEGDMDDITGVTELEFEILNIYKSLPDNLKRNAESYLAYLRDNPE